MLVATLFIDMGKIKVMVTGWSRSQLLLAKYLPHTSATTIFLKKLLCPILYVGDNGGLVSLLYQFSCFKNRCL